MRREVITDRAARSKSPYCQALVAHGPMVFVAAQPPVDPLTSQLRCGSFGQQAHQVFQNLGAVLEAAGTSLQGVLRVGVYLADLQNFREFNEIYKEYFNPPYPSRMTYGTKLVGDIALEVECLALIPHGAEAPTAEGGTH